MPAHRRSDFQPCPPQREWLAAGREYSRHRHARGYVSIILSGGFEEAGDHGRRLVGPGDALIHGPFCAHAERSMRSSELFNLALPNCFIPDVQHAMLADPDAIIRQAERDPSEALNLFFRQMRPVQPPPDDWPDLLAAAIGSGSTAKLREWADDHQLHPSSLARGFGQLYGVSPVGYRSEQRARRAWRNIVSTSQPLSGIAYDLGFSDQAHMCREVKRLTGRTPTAWRRLRKFNTWRAHSVLFAE